MNVPENHEDKKNVSPSMSGAPAYVVDSLAGNESKQGFQDGPPDQALFGEIAVVSQDDQGLLVASDMDNRALRLISPTTGVVKTLVGGPDTPQESIDGPFEQASFIEPFGCVCDVHGHIYVLDTGSCPIRVISQGESCVTTLRNKQTGECASCKEAPGATRLIAHEDKLYLSNPANHVLHQVEVSTGVTTLLAGKPGKRGNKDGPVSEARFYLPLGLGMDCVGQNLLVCDLHNHRIKSINLESRRVTTIAGNGSIATGIEGQKALEAAIPYPRHVICDTEGNIIITCRNIVRFLDIKSGIVSTIRELAFTDITCCDKYGRLFGFRGNRSQVITAISSRAIGLFTKKHLQPACPVDLPLPLLHIIAGFVI